ncbi:MAG: dTMP kinase [Alphaproteobacteria bacterium]|jgi:dTMP kinase|nr:dTMP kinase [Alphaproteobacteria bacterium]
MSAGLFLTLEGGEGAGKSTLLARLQAALLAQGRDVVATREPGGTPGADLIRALLVEGEAQRWDPLTEALLLAAARRDHIRTLIRPALERGKVVLCDRFVDSTRAYQTGAGGLPRRVVEELSALIEAPTPDVTLLLDLPPETGLERARGRAGAEDRFERLGLGFHARVRAAFLSLAREEPERFLVLDATQNPDALEEAARAGLKARLGLFL